jgi:hypothetical protein
MTESEIICREEGWIETKELEADRGSPCMRALYALRPNAYAKFWFLIEDSVMTYFNPELEEFSHCTSWEKLAEEWGYQPFEKELQIPKGLSEKGRTVARQLRNMLQKEGDDDTGGCTAFYTPEQWRRKEGWDYSDKALLVVVFDGGGFAPYFNPSYERTSCTNKVEDVLKGLGVWQDPMTHWSTTIIDND